MGDVMTERLLHERSQVEAKISNLKTVAVDQNRDLTPVDVESIKSYSERLRTIDDQLSVTTENVAMSEAIADRLATIIPGNPAATSNYRSAGDLLWDVLHQTDHDAAARYSNVKRRAAQHIGTEADQTVAVAGGFGGLAVSPVVGPVIDIYPGGRPFLSALGVRETPNSFGFMRPRIVDPDFATGVAPQTLQKQELASKKFDIASDTLQLTTLGGYLNVSQQLLSFIPSSLDIIVGQLNKRLAAATERAAIAELSLSTSTIPLAADAGAADVLKAIFDASALVYTNTGELATWIAMGPSGWARLGGLSDLAGRPMFPYLGAANANGLGNASTFGVSSIAGLSPVVTPAITDDTFWVGNSQALEAYEYRYPVLEAVEPSLLGRQIAVAASIVFYRPTTDEGAGTPTGNGAVHIAPAVAGRRG